MRMVGMEGFVGVLGDCNVLKGAGQPDICSRWRGEGRRPLGRVQMCKRKEEVEEDGEADGEVIRELQDLMKDEQEKGSNLFAGMWSGAKEAIALVFKQGDNEGIYSVGLEEGIDVIVTFQAKEDAYRYSSMLEAEDFPVAHLEIIETQVIEEICKDTGATFVYVPKGTTIMPPKVNNPQSLSDWEELTDRQSASSQDESLKRLKSQLEDLFDGQ